MALHGSWCCHILKVVIWTCLFGYIRMQCTKLTYSVEENLPPPAKVGNIGADLQKTNTAYKFEIFTDDNTKLTFDLDRAGVIKTKVQLDREKTSSYNFYVVDDNNSTVQICVTINVADVNDNAPHFDNENRVFDIHEGTTQNKFYIGSATDEDIGNNTIAGYRLASGNDDYAFNLTGNYTNPLRNKLLLTIGVNETLDYEKRKFYNLTVHVYDGGSPRLTATMEVRINVLDVNDNSPVFSQSKYSASVMENTTVGTSILEVHATDIDSGENGIVLYLIDKKTDPDDIFEVNSVSGVISLKKMLDFETRKRHDIEVKAQNPGNSIAAVAAIEINVLNVNELPTNIYINYNNNVPKISENASIGSYVARVSVSDPESPLSENNTIAVTLNVAEGKFRLEKTNIDTFMIVVAQALDRETKPLYNLTLVASDSGIPPLSATLSFVLQLDDVNDNAPVFLQSSYQANVDEMSEAGSSVISIAASDRDIGANGLILYSIRSEPGSISDWFQVDANSGLITTRGQVDCEVDAQPSFWLIATDRGIPPLTSSVKVSVSVRDINDKEPTFDRSMYTATIPENQAVQSCILQVNAIDPDCGVNGLIRYSLTGPSSAFTIQQLTGHICVSQVLDYEMTTLHEFSVIATDSGGYSATSIVQITIEDVNDNVPVFTSRNYSRNIQNSMQPGSEVLTVYATDRDSGAFGTVQYSISSGNTGSKFTINAITGTISVATSLTNTDQDYRLVIDARDGGNRLPQKADVIITITGQGYTLPVFQQSMYRFQLSEDVSVNSIVGLVTATYAGSSTGIMYTISSGNLNSFFTIGSSGQIHTTKQLDHDEYPVILLSVEAVRQHTSAGDHSGEH